jgi:hypothetical protein
LVDETLEEGCGATGSTGGFSAVLSDVDTAPRLVRLFIPSEAFPIRADGGSAKLIFVRLDAPVTEHAFVLQRQTHRYQGFFTWLLGVLTPVVIAVIGYFGASSAIAADQLNRGTPSRTRILANS